MVCSHFYHVWAAGSWERPVYEHLAALDANRFDGPFHVGIVGSPKERARVVKAIDRDFVGLYATKDFERFTLNAIRDYAQDHEGAVLYAHTKGAYRPISRQDLWRWSMTYHVVSRWRENLETLASEPIDAIGCHWTGVEAASLWGPVPAFLGNFWMATCEYLRTLPPCPTGDRGEGEIWIGRGNPRVCNLVPNPPCEEELVWENTIRDIEVPKEFLSTEVAQSWFNLATQAKHNAEISGPTSYRAGIRVTKDRYPIRSMESLAS